MDKTVWCHDAEATFYCKDPGKGWGAFRDYPPYSDLFSRLGVLKSEKVVRDSEHLIQNTGYLPFDNLPFDRVFFQKKTITPPGF